MTTPIASGRQMLGDNNKISLFHTVLNITSIFFNCQIYFITFFRDTSE